MEWYFKIDGDERGPLDDSELQELVSRGRITPDTLVKNEAMREWAPYRSAPRQSRGSLQPEPTAATAGGLLDPLEPLAPKGTGTGTVRKGRPGAGELRYGTFGARVFGKLIDVALLLVAMTFIGFIVGMFVGAGLASEYRDLQNQALGTIALWYGVSFAIPIIYNGLFVAMYEATPGKMAMGLKIVDSEGRAVTAGQAWGRAIAELLSQMTLYIGYVIAAFDKEKRTIHDHVCNTRVVRST